MSCKEQVVKYLSIQNRPYSANDIMQNLNNEYSRAIIQKALDELTLEKKIKEKIYGKQKVYSIIHVFESKELELEIKQIDIKIGETSKEIESLKEELKDTEREMTATGKYPTTENALKEKLIIEETVKKLSKELSNFPQQSAHFKEEEKNELNSIYKNLLKEYKKRKIICTDALNTILENYPKKMDVLLSEIGIETI